MSPAPYPPLHAGDDVDADFFDQLGDELDSPVKEAAAQKHQDVAAGLVNPGDSPGSGLVDSGAAGGAWISPSKVHPEEQVGLPLPQEGNSQEGVDLEDAFTNLNLETQNAQFISHGANDAHVLSNGDDVGLLHSAEEAVEAVHDSEDRVTGEESSVGQSITSTILSSDDISVAQFRVFGDTATASFDLPEFAADENAKLESEMHGELSFSADFAAEAASIVEETRRKSLPKDQGEVKLSDMSNAQAQTTRVEEVQWSNFGAQGGFGSFSDFLSAYPAYSTQPEDASAVASSSEPYFSHRSEHSTSNVGSNFVEQQYDDVSFFDLPHRHEEGAAQIAQVSPPSSATHYGTQAPLQVQQIGEIPAAVHSQAIGHSEGLEQVQGVQFDPDQRQGTEFMAENQQVQNDQVDHNQWNLQEDEQAQQTQVGQPDQGFWQELPEYPGWLYNNLTGEWMEKTNSAADVGTSTRWDYPSGQDQSQVRGGGNEITQWQGREITGHVSDEDGLKDLHLGQSTADTSVTEWRENHHSESLGTAVQQNNSGLQDSTREATNSGSQSGWEDQYPGWYYDHQSQEWKQYSQLSQVAEEEPQSTPLPAVPYEETNPSNFSQGYHAGWSAGQDQQYNAGGQFAQDLYGIPNVVPGSLQNDIQMSTPAQIPGQWVAAQNQQFDISSSYYTAGQPLSNGASQQPWSEQFNVQQVDPLKQVHLIPENQYNSYAATQMPAYAAQPQRWSAKNSYGAPYQSQYVSQTAPKSLEEALRTSVGRPPHVLTAFAFGGKLVVMKLKDPLSLQSSDGNQSFASGQAFVPGPIQVHSLSQIVAQTSDNGRGETGSSYFAALSRPTLAGPLVGGSVSSKELNKWLDDQAANCLSEEPNFRSSGSLPILWGLLKLACKHYGKLRSQAGLSGITSQEEDGAEAALAKLLTSGGDQSSWTMGSLRSTVCLQPMPSEHQLQDTASETKRLLVAGKRKEALKYAQQGQLWGPALVLARQLGEKYYADTVAAMAQRQFLPGSPLRTLSLLLAGQPAEVFREDSTQPVQGNQLMQVPSSSGNTNEGVLGSMLEEWQENLSIMAANRTNGDDRVISHLGDCLWKAKGEVAAAHICYLVADANFESFSSSARLCLVGADHWKNPRTYATPEAIQRTEVFEYSKVLGNPQFILVSFQPYKLIYASMLAEAGKTGEALRYCQAVSKTLKTASRAPEVETCKLAAASLEERLRIHMQGGNSVNLAPGKLVRGFLSALDRGIHGIIGGPPPPAGQEQGLMAPTVEPVTLQDHLGGSRFGASPSRSSAPFGPSASAEKLQESGRYMPQRSVSEPDFSASMKEKAEQGKPTTRSGYLGRFGSVFSKAGGIVSLVSKTNKKEAKLGDTNKFYYDEKLKRWVEEGVEASPEETALPPPPTSANFVSKVENTLSPDAQFGVGLGGAPPSAAPPSASKSTHLGTPPVPPSNQFSARARQQGVRSRYVDTFNKGGNSTTPPKPAVSAFTPAARFGGAPLQPMNFFVPAPSTDINGMTSNSENGVFHGNSEVNNVDQHSESGLNNQERLGASQQSAVENVFHQSGMGGAGMPLVPSSENAAAFGASAMHRVPSSDNTTAFDPSERAHGRGRLGRSPSNGEIGFSNGYHSRANSWSGYPSNFQTSQTEATSSYDNPGTNSSLYNGFSTQSTVNTPPTVGSYFPSPSKVDIFNPNTSVRLGDTFTSPPPFMPAIMGGDLRPGSVEVGGNQPEIALAGDDLQEVEL
ncbi:unnamed protein product [Calypogeia fissa]